jgi:hypothetical protein
MFKATAEAWARDPQVVEAMVEPDLAFDGLVMRGIRLKVILGPPQALRDPRNDDVQ